jgi:hypothetical protein
MMRVPAEVREGGGVGGRMVGRGECKVGEGFIVCVCGWGMVIFVEMVKYNKILMFPYFLDTDEAKRFFFH